MLINAEKKGNDLRWHERGDFYKNGSELDIEYIDNILWACRSILQEGGKLPKMWAYTHIYDPKLSRILGKYIIINPPTRR